LFPLRKECGKTCSKLAPLSGVNKGIILKTQRKKQLFFPHGVINRKVEGVDYGLKGGGQITGG
jgi:hypothetical protein